MRRRTRQRSGGYLRPEQFALQISFDVLPAAPLNEAPWRTSLMAPVLPSRSRPKTTSSTSLSNRDIPASDKRTAVLSSSAMTEAWAAQSSRDVKPAAPLNEAPWRTS